MEIIKGSKEYIDYIDKYIVQDDYKEDYILSIDEDVLVDMLESGILYTYTDDDIRKSMHDNGYTLIIE